MDQRYSDAVTFFSGTEIMFLFGAELTVHLSSQAIIIVIFNIIIAIFSTFKHTCP